MAVSFLCGNGEHLGTHFRSHPFGVFDFLGVVGRLTPPSNLGGLFVEGGGVVCEIEFGWALGILTGNVCGRASRSSRIMTPRQRNPVCNSKERQFHEIFTSLDWFYSLSTWCRPYKGSLLEAAWTFCLSLPSTHPRD